jgi:hypothetical protein
VVFSFFSLTATLSATPLLAEQGNASNPSKEEVIQEIQKLQAPFIANNGQVDERVRFYAKTFGGTVFVTKDGEIVYSLPKGRLGIEGAKGNVGKQDAEHRMREEGIIASSQNVQRGFNVLPHTSGDLPGLHGQVPLVHAGSVFSASILLPFVSHERQMNRASAVTLKEQLVGGTIGEIKGGAESVATVNYFTGNDLSKWQSNISTYEIVDMGEVYEGIGLRLKAYGNNVEKLFTVKPDANHEAIKIRLEGAQGLTVNETGELVVKTELGPVKFTKPLAYQEIDGNRVEVAVKYRIQESLGCTTAIGEQAAGEQRGREAEEYSKLQNSETPQLTYSFEVASYDKTKDLIIDPLIASTYLGGVYEDYGRSIAIDAGGNVYVVGETLSTDLPTTPGAYDTSRSNNTDVFVSKFNSGLTSLLASTFLGGSFNHDRGYSIAVDAGGNVYVTGATYSTNFPTTRGAYDTAGNGRWDVFVSKFNSGLTSLLASTFLGRNSDEYGYSIAIDAGGNVYVTGETLSSDFPTTPGAYDTSYNSGYHDAFVSKFNSGLTSLLASTFLGGGSGDYGRSIAVDAGGNVFVTGNTWSKDFPTTSGVYTIAHNGGNDDAFVSKLNSGLTSLLASTFLGGYSNDYGKSIVLDSVGNVYVTGETVSPNFPTTDGAYDTSYNRGSKDTFVSKFNSGLTSLLASTFLGGISNDCGKSIAIDAGGNVYVTGTTHSTDFPTTAGACDTSSHGDGNVFVSKLNSGLTSLLVSTFQGGSRSDYGNSIAIDAGGNVYVIGETESPDFPTTDGAYETSYHRCEDIFVSKFNAILFVDKASK